MADMQRFEQAVDQVIIDSDVLHLIINGTATESAIAEDGSLLPSVRKAMLDNLYFKTPPIPWQQGVASVEYNQLYVFNEPNRGASWWYAPAAMLSNPIVMGAAPHNDPNWRLIIDTASIAEIYAPLISPNFTGNPQAPTATFGDSSRSIATTEFVAAVAADLLGQIGAGGQGRFTTINVSGLSTLNTMTVTGNSTFTANILAPNSESTFKKITLQTNFGELAFAYSESGKRKTSIKPHTVDTSVVTSDSITSLAATLGVTANTGTTVTLRGGVDAEYVHIKGSSARPSTEPQLVVDGIAKIGALDVTGPVTGAGFSVDGKPIQPSSVSSPLGTFTNLNVTNNLVVGNKTTTKDLEVTGTVTGAGFSVNGKDITPRSVVATEQVNAKNMTVTEKVKTKDLEITGTVTGYDPITGKNLNPASVTTTGTMAVGSTLSVLSGKTTVQDLQFLGALTDPAGNPVNFSGGSLIGVRVFTNSSGETAYTPTAGTKSVLIKLVGAGGAGGDSASVTSPALSVGGGGGAGAYQEHYTKTLADFTGKVVIVGKGGVPSGTIIGGDSSFGVSGGTKLLTAAGGQQGADGASGTVYVAGAGGGGKGQISQKGNVVSTPGGDGNAGIIYGTFAVGGAGGNSAMSVNSNGSHSMSTSSGNGFNGIDGVIRGPGSGGDGAVSKGAAAFTGGIGADGIVIIYEYS